MVVENAVCVTTLLGFKNHFYAHLLRRLLIVAHFERLFHGDDAHVDILYGCLNRSVAQLAELMEARSKI